MKVLIIAQAAHAINAALCLSLGDNSQVAWDDAPEEQRQSAINGVNMHLANPDATPEDSHASWLAEKLANGWTYGETKDVIEKKHPCCVPYDELPTEQKSKDYIFRAVVHALKDIPDADEAVANALAEFAAKQPKQSGEAIGRSMQAAPGFIPVVFIGKRDTWKDNIYGSELTFTKGQARAVPGHLAAKLLQHVDVFAKADMAEVAPTDPVEAASIAKAQARREEQQIEEDVAIQLQGMTKKGLVDFAQSKYGVKLNNKLSIEALQQEVRQLIATAGVV